MSKKPLNDGTDGFRFNYGITSGIYRKRLIKKRKGIQKGDTFTAFHYGKRSLYIEQFRPFRFLWNW